MTSKTGFERTMKESILHNTAKACCAIFCILIAVHGFEAIVLRMDETVFGENFINKIFGIFVLWLVLRVLEWKWKDIGFSGSGLFKNIALGLLLGAAVFTVAYTVEVFVLKMQGYAVRFGFFTTGFSLTGASEIHRGVGFILLCVFFNIIKNICPEQTTIIKRENRSAMNHYIEYQVSVCLVV